MRGSVTLAGDRFCQTELAYSISPLTLHLQKRFQSNTSSQSTPNRQIHERCYQNFSKLANGNAKKAASQVQWGTFKKDNGALTESPLCHRRWHFSPPLKPPRLVPSSLRSKHKNPLHVINSHKTRELEPTQSVKEEGEKIGVHCQGSTRSYPGRPTGVVDTGSIRGSSRVSLLTG